MVKGNSRQVIVVPSPDPKLFEQAIFILRRDAVRGEGVSDRELLRQARQAAEGYLPGRKRHLWGYGAFWAALGAMATGLAWLLTWLL